MTIAGSILIGAEQRYGAGPAVKGFDPKKQVELEPAFGSAAPQDVAEACALAEAAAPALRALSPSKRADFLELMAQRLNENSAEIVARGMAETGLPEARLQGEMGRTCGQLRMFATTLRDGTYLDVRIDQALPDRAPPRPDIRMMMQPLGPVAVFAASNFPLAFSVAGGDTASAFAAGCPVIVKGHNAHPGTSELVGRVIQSVVAESGLPAGTFSLIFGNGSTIGKALVQNPAVQAVGFTGSRNGGLALVAASQARTQPIPVYAEMSAINPVILLPGALAERGADIGKAFAEALNLGAGQFCTNPGLILAIDGPDVDAFIAGTSVTLANIAPGTMLSAGIHSAYCTSASHLAGQADVELLASGPTTDGLSANSALYGTTAAAFRANPILSEEVFGATSLLVRCADADDLKSLVNALEGQLTLALHSAESDLSLAGELLPIAERKAGRILFNGFGTGVEVCDAMVHGGPYPSTSDTRTTSVGSLAIQRFLRPVCYQNVPAQLLPAAIAEGNPLNVPQRINGQRA